MLALLDAGLSYDDIGERLQVQPGLAYLVATGMPADGSDAPSASADAREGVLPTSQHLSNPEPAENPTGKESVREWLRRRATADEAMQLAAARRRPAAPLGSRGSGDLVDLLTQEHNHVTSLLKQLSAVPGARKGGTPSQVRLRQALGDEVARELVPHLEAEQRLLWPTVREALPDGGSWADQGEEAGSHGLDLARRLGASDASTEEFDDCVEEVSAASRKHVALTGRVFLRLRDELPAETLAGMAVELAGEEH